MNITTISDLCKTFTHNEDLPKSPTITYNYTSICIYSPYPFICRYTSFEQFLIGIFKTTPSVISLNGECMAVFTFTYANTINYLLIWYNYYVSMLTKYVFFTSRYLYSLFNFINYGLENCIHQLKNKLQNAIELFFLFCFTDKFSSHCLSIVKTIILFRIQPSFTTNNRYVIHFNNIDEVLSIHPINIFCRAIYQ